MKSCGEQRTGECFGLLSNETIKMKQFLPLMKEDIMTCGRNLGYLSDWWSDSKAMRAAFNIWNKSLQKEGEIWKGQGLWFFNVVAEKSKLKSTFRKKYLSARDSWWKECIGNPFLLWPPWSVRDVHNPETCLSFCQLHPFKCDTVLTTACCLVSSSSERLWETGDFMWIYQILESAPSWFGRRSTWEKRKLMEIISICSFPLGFSWLRFSWESFLFKLTHLYFIPQKQDCFLSVPKAEGPCTLRVCHSFHCPTRC